MKTVRSMSINWCLLFIVWVFGVGSGQAANRDEIIFFFNDAQGSAVAAVNEAGELCWSEEYTAYGDKSINDDVFSEVGCGIVGEERGFTGHTEDVNSDLVYMQQRYYDPSIGRFLSIDPLDANPNQPMSFNRYAYGNNNPYKYTDPDGRSPDLLYISDPMAYTQMIGDFIGADPSTKAGSQQINDYNSEMAFKQLDALGIFGGIGLAAKSAKIAGRGVTKGVGGSANFAQKTFSESFSAGGKFAGKTIDDVASALRSGSLKASDVPIDVITRNGNTLILNTRSAQALARAGIPRSQWNSVNRTGQEAFEARLTGQLTGNKLSDQGISTVRQSGGN